jgi:hypothetical protein
MKACRARPGHWLVVEALPVDAPELNPVEAPNSTPSKPAGATSTAVRWPTSPPDTLDEAITATTNGITRLRRRRTLLFAFPDRTGLSP